jgi:hypothetical protein
MVRLFRAMREDASSFPQIGRNVRTLGIRPGKDVPAMLPNDLVNPGEGGLSVSPDDPLNLPYFRRPPEFQGTGQDPVWVFESNQLGADLYYRADPSHAGHGFIEPTRTMTLDEFEQAIIGIQKLWQKEKP